MAPFKIKLVLVILFLQNCNKPNPNKNIQEDTGREEFEQGLICKATSSQLCSLCSIAGYFDKALSGLF